MKKYIFTFLSVWILTAGAAAFAVADRPAVPEAAGRGFASGAAANELLPENRDSPSVWKKFAGEPGWWIGLILAMFAFCSVRHAFLLKRMKRLNMIFTATAVHAVAVDGGGRVRFYRGSPDEGAAPVRTFEDLPEEIRKALREPVRQVLETGNPQQVQYGFRGRCRRAELVRLDKRVFGATAVLWTSFDVDDFHYFSERFHTALNSIGEGVVTVDASGIVTFANRAAAQLLGCAGDELIGRKIGDFARLFGEPDPVRRAMDEKTAVEFSENAGLTESGCSRHQISGAASPIQDDAGNVEGAVLLIRNVATVKQGERAHREMEALFSTLLENLPCGVWVLDVDDDYRMIFSSRISRQALGMSQEELQGKKGVEVMRPEVAAELAKYDREAVEAGIVTVQTMPFTCGNGEVRVGRIQRVVVRVSGGHSLLLCVSIDITDESRRSHEFHEANRLLQAIQDNLPCAFFVKDADDDFKYLMANRNYAEFLSSSSENILGRTDFELYPDPANARACLSSDRLTIEHGSCDVDERVMIGGSEHILRCIKSRLIRDDGRRLLVGICVDMTREKHLQQELLRLMEDQRIHAEQEHLLNRCLESALLKDDEDSAIRFVLEMIGERLKADHAYCFRYDYQQNIILPNQEWARDGQSARLEDMPHFPIDRDAGWLKMFHERKILSMPDVSTPEARAVHGRWAELMPKLSVRSLFAIGIRRDGELWGHIGLSYTSRKNELSEPEKNLLQSCAHIVEVILERRKNRDELKRSEYEKLLLMDSIHIPIMLFNEDLKLIRCNNAALEIAGIPEEQVYSQECWRTFCGGECRYRDCPVALAGHDLRMHSRELRVKGRDYQLTSYPIMVDGKLLYIMKTMVDITEINDLLKNQQVVNFCLETLLGDDDMDHAIRQALEAVCRHLGASRSYILQFHSETRTLSCLVEYIAPGREPIFGSIKDKPYSAKPDWATRFQEDPDIVIEDMAAAAEENVGTLWVETVRRHQIKSFYGKRLILDSGVWGYLGLVFEEEPRRFTENDGRFISAVAHFVELMLERRRAQGQLLAALKKAQDASRAKSYFLATMSHELRTPLNAVIGFSELLQNSELSRREHDDYLRAINLAGNSLLSLINDVLDLSKLEAEQMVLAPRPTDMRDIVDEIRAVFQYKIRQKKLDLVLELPEDVPVLKLDSLRLRQIMLNLIGNAVKFTERGSIAVAIDFRRTAEQSGDLEIGVRDTGIGIPAQAQAKIFEPFIQSDASRDTHAYNGTGLGLAISSRLAECMGGSIRLESEEGKGSCFTLSLNNVEVARQVSAPSEAESERVALPGHIRVLLVDDVPMNLKVLSAMLRKLNVDSVCAGSGGEALAILEKDRNFKIIMTDLWMPEMNGERLAGAVRAMPELEGAILVAVTADSESEANFDQSAFHRVLLKPVTLEKIQELLAGAAIYFRDNP